jgi:hypothetical protein
MGGLRCLVVACAAALTACVDQTAITPTADELVVQAVLDAGAGDQYVLVQSTTGGVSSATTVSSATVTLTLPDGRVVRATEELDTTEVRSTNKALPRIKTVYRFALDTLGVALVPGGVYGLRVETPSGGLVTGITRIPTAPVAIVDAGTFSFDRASDTIALAWPRVRDARSYELHVHSSISDYSIFADTSITLTGATQSRDGTHALVAGQTNQIVVSAVDSNYYDYYSRSADLFTGVGALSHLSGGTGVFGSIVELKIRNVAVR